MVMVMNDLLPPPLCNVNRPSHSEIQLFQNLTMKIHGQVHVCWNVKVTFDLENSKVKVMVKVKPDGHIWGLGVQSIYLLFVPWQLDHFGLRYSKFYLWPWKFKVKVMAKVKPDGHIWALEFNRYVCFSLRGNRTIFGWDIANSIFDLENSRSRS